MGLNCLNFNLLNPKLPGGHPSCHTRSSPPPDLVNFNFNFFLMFNNFDYLSILVLALNEDIFKEVVVVLLGKKTNYTNNAAKIQISCFKVMPI